MSSRLFIFGSTFLLLSLSLSPVLAHLSVTEEAREDSLWLQGRWRMAYDPDNSPPDEVVFYPGGALVLQMPDGKDIVGSYLVQGEWVILSLVAPNRPVRLRLSVSEERTKLITDSGAYYTKY